MCTAGAWPRCDCYALCALHYACTTYPPQALEATQKVEAELLACRQRITLLESQLRGRERDVERLSRQLDVSGSSVAETAVVADRVGEVARKLDMDVAHFKARVVQLENTIKVWPLPFTGIWLVMHRAAARSMA